MDYSKYSENEHAFTEGMTPERAENIRNRWLNSGVAVPDELHALHGANDSIVTSPPMRAEELRPKPKRDAAALKRFRGTLNSWGSVTGDSEQSPPQKGR